MGSSVGKFFIRKDSRKRPKEKWLDYYHRNKAGRCDYCNLKTPKEKCKLIRKLDDINSRRISENRGNIALICGKCKVLKKSMNHDEFKKFVRQRNKELRSIIFENRKKIRKKIIKKYNGECIFCTYEFGFTPTERKKTLTIEHKTPLSSLGDNSNKNLACSCYAHNNEKGGKTAVEYFEFLKVSGRKYNALKYF